MSLKVTWHQFRALPEDVQAGLAVAAIGFTGAAVGFLALLGWIIRG